MKKFLKNFFFGVLFSSILLTMSCEKGTPREFCRDGYTVLVHNDSQVPLKLYVYCLPAYSYYGYAMEERYYTCIVSPMVTTVLFHSYGIVIDGKPCIYTNEGNDELGNIDWKAHNNIGLVPYELEESGGFTFYGYGKDNSVRLYPYSWYYKKNLISFIKA